jgi:hypothetical protein
MDFCPIKNPDHRVFQAGVRVHGQGFSLFLEMLGIHDQEADGRAFAGRGYLDSPLNPAIPDKEIGDILELRPDIRMPNLGIILVNMFFDVNHPSAPG